MVHNEDQFRSSLTLRYAKAWGWGLPLKARKEHFFDENGESLCQDRQSGRSGRPAHRLGQKSWARRTPDEFRYKRRRCMRCVDRVNGLFGKFDI